MPYKSNIHHRRSIRLKGYDYSKPVLYFIAIYCQNHAHFSGLIEGRMMKLNDAGKMVEQEWLKISQRFPNTQLHEYIVMPNHFHVILEITDSTAVRATLLGAHNIPTGSAPSKVGQPQGIAQYFINNPKRLKN